MFANRTREPNLSLIWMAATDRTNLATTEEVESEAWGVPESSDTFFPDRAEIQISSPKFNKSVTASFSS